MNVANILALATVIEKVDPDAFSMVQWDCGTYACIGGWTERVFPRERSAAHALDLDPKTADQLFYPTPTRCSELDNVVLERYIWSIELQLADVGKVLRHLAATRTVDWSVLQEKADAWAEA